jgi:uncharacterized membrane protein SpoIIM required for sporulation
MNEETLVNRRIADWKRLEALCVKADLRVSNLTETELFEFVRLYRKASTDLSVIRTRSQNIPLSNYLNNLVGRAHALIYGTPQKRFFRTIELFILNVVLTFRRNKAFFWASFALAFGSAIFAYAMIAYDHSNLHTFAGGMEENFSGWKEGKFEGRNLDESLAMSFFYASNNPTVSIIAGAIGAATMGLGSIGMMVQNGAIIGALAFEMNSVNKLYFLLSSIAPHGVPEISGIIFSGAGGLRLGWAILAPGLLTRGESLRRASRDAVTMIVTGVLLCFIAAPIEGFFSFNPAIPQGLKTAVAVAEVCMWTAFWSLYGKDVDPNDPLKE